MDVSVSPRLVDIELVLRSPENYFLMDGHELESEDDIPEKIRDIVLPQCIGGPINPVFPVMNPNDATSTTGKNEFCRIISSKPVINPANGGIAMPMYAFMGCQEGVAPRPTEQFLSKGTAHDPVYIGVMLDKSIGDLTLDEVDIIVRVPVDKERMLPGANLEYNRVPVPVLYQLFGTHDHIEEGQDISQAKWEDISGPTRIDPSDWAYMQVTNFSFVGDNVDPATRRYHGFKFVVYEWDTSKAFADDMHFGLSRIHFAFNEDELNELRNRKLCLPDLNTKNQDPNYTMAYCLTEDDTEELIGTSPDPKIEFDEKALKERMEEAIDKAVDSFREEIRAITPMMQAEINDRLTKGMNGIMENRLLLIKQNMDKIETFLKSFSEKKRNELSEFIDNEIGEKLPPLMDEITDRAKRIIQAEAHPFISAELEKLKAVGFSSLDEFNTWKDETVTEVTKLKEQLKEQIENTQPVTETVDLTSIEQSMKKEFAKTAESINSVLAKLGKFEKNLEHMKETTDLVVVEDNTNGDTHELDLNALRQDMIVVNEHNSKEKTIKLVLPKKVTNGERVNITNMRTDGGSIRIDGNGALLSVICQGRAYDNLAHLTLTDRGEHVSVIFFNGSWVGRVETGINS